MRSLILISILLLILPFSTFAFPHQRRSVVEPVAGSSKVVEDAANKKPASLSGVAEPVKTEAGPPPARADPEKTLPDEFTRPPPEVEPTFVQRIQKALKASGGKTSKNIRVWLDARYEKAEADWKKEHDTINAKTRSFTAIQRNKLMLFGSSLSLKKMGYREKQSKILEADDVKQKNKMAAQESKQRQYLAAQQARRWRYVADQERKRRRFEKKQASKLAQWHRKQHLGGETLEGFKARQELEGTTFKAAQERKFNDFQRKVEAELTNFFAKQNDFIARTNEKRTALIAVQEAKMDHFNILQDAKLAKYRNELEDEAATFRAKQQARLEKADAKRARVQKWIDRTYRKFYGTRPRGASSDRSTPASSPPSSPGQSSRGSGSDFEG